LIRAEEVNIPDEGGLHYCDPLWEVYPSCVEVMFAIVRQNDSVYLMPKGRLDEMWQLKGGRLRELGYCPYSPPKPLSSINGWVWIASMLSLLLVILLLSCSAWLWNEPEGNAGGSNHSGREAVGAEDLGKDSTESKVGGEGINFFDRDNPIYSVIAKIRKGTEESRYLEMVQNGGVGGSVSSSGYNTAIEAVAVQSNLNSNVPVNGSNGSAVSSVPSFNTTTKRNVLFQEQEVTFDFHHDNPAFVEEEEGDEEVIYGTTFRPQRQKIRYID
jgi:hypothetical protein